MQISRRRSLKQLATLATALPGLAASAEEPGTKRGRIKQSVVPWCFKGMPVPELGRLAASLGMKSVELCDPEFWPELQRLGLTCALAGSHGFNRGFAHLEEHEECLSVLRKRIPECARAGVASVITFSGFRRGISDEEGLANMVAGLKKIIPLAEEQKVTLCLEMLNSRVSTEMKGHPDYFCDNIERTVEVCRQVGSGRMKALFDLYHVQIMHGDVITRLREHMPFIGHIHTAGVPGRNEIDHRQELNYPALMNTLIELGYSGYVGQEFIPTGDAASSLAAAFKLCDV